MFVYMVLMIADMPVDISCVHLFSRRVRKLEAADVTPFFYIPDPRLVEFVRSRKAQSVHSSASPSRPPQGESRTESVPLDNVSRESDSPKAAVPSQRPHVEEMEEEAKEGKPPPPPAAIGTGIPDQPSFFASSFFLQLLFSLVLSNCNLAARTVKLGAGLSIMKPTIKSGCFSSLPFISPAFISLLFSSPSKHPFA